MAKKNKINVDVNVDDKGTTKKVGLGAKQAADNLDRTGKSAHSADRQLKGAARASSNTTKNFSKMSQGISGGLVPAYATLAAQLFAVSAAFQFLKSAGDVKTLREGQLAYASATGIAMKTLANDIIAATESQISFQDASQAAAIGISSGLSPDQLNRLGTAAKSVSVILGRDVTDSFNRLVRGVTKAEPELLDELGIVLRLEKATTTYAESLGKNANELSAFERSQAVANEVLRQAEERFVKIEQALGLPVNQFNQLGKAFDDILIRLKKLVANFAGPLAKVLTDMPLLVGGAFAFFLKGILTAAIPNIAAFGEKVRDAAAMGKAEMAALHAEVIAANRALAVATNNPQAVAKAAAGSRVELAGGLQAAGLGAAYGLGGFASGKGGSMEEIEFAKKKLESLKGAASDIDDALLDDMLHNLSDLEREHATTHDNMGKKTKRTFKGMGARVGLFKAETKLAFADIQKKAAGVLSFLGGAFTFLGIGALAITLGSLAVNLFKSGDASRKATSEFDAQERQAERLRAKVRELNEEFKDFNKIQAALYGDEGASGTAKHLGALANRMGMISEKEFEQLLGGGLDTTITQKSTSTQGGPKTRFVDLQAQFAERQRLMNEIAGIGTKRETYRDGKKSRTVSLDPERLEELTDKLNDLGGPLAEGATLFDALANSNSKSAAFAALVSDELKGITPEMTKGNDAAKNYHDALMDFAAGGETSKETLIKLRQSFIDTGKSINQIPKLLSQANTSFQRFFEGRVPTSKYKTAITDTKNAIAAIEKEDKLDTENQKTLPGLRKRLGLLEGLETRDDNRRLQDAQLKRQQVEEKGNLNRRFGTGLATTMGKERLDRKHRTENEMLKRDRAQEEINTNLALIQTEKDKALIGEKANQDKIDALTRTNKLLKEQKDLHQSNIDIIKEEGDHFAEVKDTIVADMEKSLGSAFESIIDGSKSASDAFDDFAKSILASLAKIAAEKFAEQLIGDFFGGSKIGDASVPTVGKRMGGIVKGYSKGGIARGRDSGFPVILHGTEAVVPLPDGNKIPVELKNGGQGDQNNISIVINTEGETTATGEGRNVEQQRQLGKVIAAVVQQELVKQKRPGGILSPYGAT